MITNADLTAAAFDLKRGGLSVIPVRPDGSKAPALPAGHPVLNRKRVATDQEIHSWYADECNGLAVLAGPISDNAECIDFDEKGILREWVTLVMRHVPELPQLVATVRTPHGDHCWYKCEERPEGNLVLARDAEGKKRVETRGDGGYAIVPPTPGYEWDEGRPMCKLGTIPARTRQLFLEFARSFNQKADPAPTPATPAPPDGGTRPGDDFNRHGPAWAALLEPHGWKAVSRSGEVTYWQRPDKSGPGKSATTGYCKSADGLTDYFYPFTTSAAPFAALKAYSKYAVYTILDHDGDWARSAKALAAKGFGSRPRPAPSAPAPPATLVDQARAAAQAARPQPKGFTADALMREILAPPRWAVPDLIAEGFSIVAGRPKAGKSWLLLHTAIQVATGGAVLDEFPVEAGPVLYLALEDTKRRLQKRIGQLRDRNDDLSRLHLFIDWPNVSEGGLEAIDARVRDIGPRLVIVDTMARLRGPQHGNDNAYASDYAFVVNFKRIADKYATSVIGVFHTAKAIRADPVDEVSGTLGLSGGADSILVLKRERQAAEATLFLTGRDVEEREIAITADVASRVWHSHGDASLHRISQERRAILELLKFHADGLKPKEVSDLLGMNASSVRRLMSQMAEAGQLRPHYGRYKPPEQAEQRTPPSRASSASTS